MGSVFFLSPDKTLPILDRWWESWRKSPGGWVPVMSGAGGGALLCPFLLQPKRSAFASRLDWIFQAFKVQSNVCLFLCGCWCIVGILGVCAKTLTMFSIPGRAHCSACLQVLWWL